MGLAASPTGFNQFASRRSPPFSIFKRNGKRRVAQMSGLTTPIDRAPVRISDSITKTLKIDLAWRGQSVREFDRLARPNRFRSIGLAGAKIDSGMKRSPQVGDRFRARVCDSDNGGYL